MYTHAEYQNRLDKEMCPTEENLFHRTLLKKLHCNNDSYSKM